MIYRNVTREQLTEIVTLAVQKALTSEMPKVLAPEMQKALTPEDRLVPVGISMRHVHLNRADLTRLFGASYMLTSMKDLSQPGQFAAEECVDVIGPKGTLKRCGFSVRCAGKRR